MAAVLRCGPGAVLSHESAAELDRIRPRTMHLIEVTVPAGRAPRVPGIRVHRRNLLPHETKHAGAIPLTSPVRTLVDLSSRLSVRVLEAAVTEADVLDLVDPQALRDALGMYGGRRGVRKLRAVLDRHTYRMTETELERRFLRLVRRAGLPLPDTQQHVGGRVDFYWSELGLVVETDGWRYHRTPARQARDNRRMQEHAAAGRTAVRVSHYEVRYEPARIEVILAQTIERLAA
jgi:very-short-patch-repair endonuclease